MIKRYYGDFYAYFLFLRLQKCYDNIGFKYLERLKYEEVINVLYVECNSIDDVAILVQILLIMFEFFDVIVCNECSIINQEKSYYILYIVKRLV